MSLVEHGNYLRLTIGLYNLTKNKKSELSIYDIINAIRNYDGDVKIKDTNKELIKSIYNRNEVSECKQYSTLDKLLKEELENHYLDLIKSIRRVRSKFIAHIEKNYDVEKEEINNIEVKNLLEFIESIMLFYCQELATNGKEFVKNYNNDIIIHEQKINNFISNL